MSKDKARILKDQQENKQTYQARPWTQVTHVRSRGSGEAEKQGSGKHVHVKTS